jgi:hypothetical protein
MRDNDSHCMRIVILTLTITSPCPPTPSLMLTHTCMLLCYIHYTMILIQTHTQYIAMNVASTLRALCNR